MLTKDIWIWVQKIDVIGLVPVAAMQDQAATMFTDELV